MNKIFSLIIFSVALVAFEFPAMILSSSYNYRINWVYKNTTFSCSPLALITVSQLALNQNLPPSCKERIKNFLGAHPGESSIGIALLKSRQRYHIINDNNQCVMMLNGGKSYGQALLEKGFAYLVPFIKIKDRVLEYRLGQSALKAKLKEIGIWKDPILARCFLFNKL
jgi:hypothetical protein